LCMLESNQCLNLRIRTPGSAPAVRPAGCQAQPDRAWVYGFFCCARLLGAMERMPPMMERTSTPASTATRRQFLACGLAAPVAYAGLRSGQPNDSDALTEGFSLEDTSAPKLSPAHSGRAR